MSAHRHTIRAAALLCAAAIVATPAAAEAQLVKLKDLGKRAAAGVVEKMVEGTMAKFRKENALLSQLFVIDGKTPVADVVASAAKDAGTSITLKDFVRFQLGEGIEKKESDFAAEVAAAAGLSVLLSDSAHDPARERAALELYQQLRVRGVILAPVSSSPEEELSRRLDMPVVLADRFAAYHDTCTVSVDDFVGGQLAAQHLLREQGYGIAADGIFGPLSGAAVNAFQQTLRATFISTTLGQLDWPALIVTISQGDAGHAVRAAQTLLPGGLTVDGDFGPLTDAAVRDFQQMFAPPADGVVGSVTWHALTLRIFD